VTERSVATTTHGRYLVLPPASPGPAPILVGFHGYGEDAEAQLERLRAISESSHWLCISIQALHRFYDRRTGRVVASWMTRQDRDLAIADNIAYVTKCIDAAASEWPTLPKVVFTGFSQGVATAFRAAVNSTRTVVGVIAVGGDVPPELPAAVLSQISTALVARGATDHLYPPQKFAEDQRRLREASVNVHALEFNGAHEWSGEVIAAASTFLTDTESK
jgi:predicted esterase